MISIEYLPNPIVFIFAANGKEHKREREQNVIISKVEFMLKMYPNWNKNAYHDECGPKENISDCPKMAL